MGKNHVLSNCYAQRVIKPATIAARSSLQALVRRVFNLKKNEHSSTTVRLSFNHIPNLGSKKGLNPNGL
jgi:hypothetical protein